MCVRVCVCACARVCVCACARVCVRVRVRVRVRVYVCVQGISPSITGRILMKFRMDIPVHHAQCV